MLVSSTASAEIFAFVLCVACFGVTTASLPDCGDAYECINEVVDNAGNLSASLINCFGYKACTDITITSQVPEVSLRCRGAGACINATTNSTSFLIAKGYASAAFASIVAEQDVSCHGRHSCLGSTRLESLTKQVECYGELSCAYANIYGDVKSFGAFGLLHANIYSQGKDITLDLYSLFAGYKSILHCHENDTCNLKCYGNGCFGMQLNCTGSCSISCFETAQHTCPSDSNFYNINNLTLSDAAPDVVQVLQQLSDIYEYEVINLDNINVDPQYYIMHNLDALLDDNNAGLIALNWRQYYSYSNVLNVSNGSLLSFGHVATSKGAGVVTTGSESDIFCHGGSSCQASGLIKTDASVFAHGYNSVSSSEILFNKILTCSSWRSCNSANVTGIYSTHSTYSTYSTYGTNNTHKHSIAAVVFSAWSSGRETDILGGVANLYVMGSDAIRENNITAYSDINIYLMSFRPWTRSEHPPNVVCTQNATCTIYCFDHFCRGSQTTPLNCETFDNATCEWIDVNSISFDTLNPTQVPSRQPSDITEQPSTVPSMGAELIETTKEDIASTFVPLESFITTFGADHSTAANSFLEPIPDAKSDDSDNELSTAGLIFAIGSGFLCLATLLGCWCCCRVWRKGKEAPRIPTFSAEDFSSAQSNGASASKKVATKKGVTPSGLGDNRQRRMETLSTNDADDLYKPGESDMELSNDEIGSSDESNDELEVNQQNQQNEGMSDAEMTTSSRVSRKSRGKRNDPCSDSADTDTNKSAESDDNVYGYGYADETQIDPKAPSLMFMTDAPCAVTRN